VGITTAADVEYSRARRVEGIGDAKASDLVAWRNQVASFAQVPTALSQANVSAIKAKYDTQKRQLVAQRDAAQQRMSMEVNAVRARAADEIRTVNDGQAAAQATLSKELRSIDAQYGQLYATLAQTQSNVSAEATEQCRKVDEEINRLRKAMGEQHWQLTRTRRDMIAYSDVTFGSYFRKVLGLRTL
jgi:chromosome segregation ATPase